MQRRNAIKTLSLGMGVTMSAGAFTLFLQGCKSDSVIGEDAGAYGSTPQRNLVRQLVDAILPSTDLPAASEVGLVDYINGVVTDVYNDIERSKFVKGLSLTKAHIETKTGKNLHQLEDEQVAQYLEGLLGAGAEPIRYQQMLQLTKRPMNEVPIDDLDDYNQYSFLHALKEMTVNGYCQSEFIGEEVLQYLPAPGSYDGHLAYKGEKVYSLR